MELQRARMPDFMNDPMPPEELRTIMGRLGYQTHAGLAEAIGVSRPSVSLWAEGKISVPRPIAMLLRMMAASERRPADKRR